MTDNLSNCEPWSKNLVAPDTSIRDVIRILDSTQLKNVYVVDEGRQLLGSITDGDIRRAFLQGMTIDGRAEEVMNVLPISASSETPRAEILLNLKSAQIISIPVIDRSSRVIDIVTEKEGIGHLSDDTPRVVLMAGGLGTRLHPLTKELPKPLVMVGGKPLLETIMDNFAKHGFRRFIVSINYKGELIKQHFGDGRHLGFEITYIEEKGRLGTAGALRLIPDLQPEPLIVMNGDLLTTVNFNHLLDYHRDRNGIATMCVRDYKLQVPFGVADIEEGVVTKIVEKPSHNFFVNAGIYVLEPKIFDLMPDRDCFDMTDLIGLAIEKNESVSAFPLREYWLDIGRHVDLDKANQEFDKMFSV